jgi:hypothetical protein
MLDARVPIIAYGTAVWLPSAISAGRFAVKIAISGVAGVAIAAPILTAFADYLLCAETGPHSGAGFASIYLSPTYLVLMEVPYLLGGFF